MGYQNIAKKDISTHDIGNQFIFAGPLNLNRETRQASTIMGSDILLGEKDFDALFVLAMNEGEYITFERLHKASWGKSKATESLDNATAALEKLVQQINSAGDEFMWIEHTPEMGYRFKTNWGKNPHTQKVPEISITDNSTKVPEKPRLMTLAAILTGAGSLAAAVMLTLLLLYSTGIMTPQEAEPLYIEVEDPNIPLAAPENVD